MDQAYHVKYIKVFNVKNGQYTSLLENADIHVGTNLCAKVGSRLPVYEVVQFECVSPEEERINVFDESQVESDYEGAYGSEITI